MAASLLLAERGDALAEAGVELAVFLGHLLIQSLVVSWNFKHIVSLKTRRTVGALSREMGYYDLDIASREDVVNELP